MAPDHGGDGVSAPATSAPPTWTAVSRRWWFRALAVLGALGVAYSYLRVDKLTKYAVDLDVYRLGARAWLDHQPLYAAPFTTFYDDHLAFTYPPISAILLSPLAWLPFTPALVIWSLVTLVLLVVTLGLVLHATGTPAGTTTWWWLLVAVVALTARLEPIRSTLGYGQVNVVLMTAVLADCLLVRTRWPRGVLVGIVAAFKLTPAVFVLYFLVRRDYRAAATAAVSGALVTAVGFVLNPSGSVQFWFHSLFDTTRVGYFTYSSNQNLRGIIARFGMVGTTATVAWLATSLLVVAVGVVAMRRAHQARLAVLAVSLNGVVGLLISPVSWSHHWVWCVPALLALASVLATTRSRGAGALLVLGAAAFALAPQWRLPHDNTSGIEVSWAVWQKVVGNAYTWWALALLAVAAVAAQRWGSEPVRETETVEVR